MSVLYIDIYTAVVFVVNSHVHSCLMIRFLPQLLENEPKYFVNRMLRHHAVF